MDYIYIEELVKLSKVGDKAAKEKLVEEFTPLIIKLSKKSFINSYEFDDIKNECFKTLFKCVNLYSVDKHRFVAYATNAIKNSVNHLIRVSVRRDSSEGPVALIFDGKLDNCLYYDIQNIDDIIMDKTYQYKLKGAIEMLNHDEKELIAYVYFKKYSLKKYADLKSTPYSSIVNKKKNIIKKLKKLIFSNENNYYLN